MVKAFDLKNERRFYEKVFKPYMEATGISCEWVEDMKRQKQDIDVIGRRNGSETSFSLKVVRKIFPGICAETVSNDRKQTEGWLFYSKAQFIAWCMPVPLNKAFDVRMFTLKQVRNYYEIEEPTEEPIGSTLGDNGRILYHTLGFFMPFNKIEHDPIIMPATEFFND